MSISKHERAAATRARAISRATAAAGATHVAPATLPAMVSAPTPPSWRLSPTPPSRRLSEKQAGLVRSTRLAVAEIQRQTRRVDRLVVAMRNSGMTWPQVASALDVTRQAAQKRYATQVAPNPAY